MSFWTRVDVEQPTEVQTGTGNPRQTWATLLSDVEARVLPLTSDENVKQWATPEEHAYMVLLRLAQPSIRPTMRVVVDAVAYDVRRVIQPPPFGDPTTILQCVLVTP